MEMKKEYHTLQYQSESLPFKFDSGCGNKFLPKQLLRHECNVRTTCSTGKPRNYFGFNHYKLLKQNKVEKNKLNMRYIMVHKLSSVTDNSARLVNEQLAT